MRSKAEIVREYLTRYPEVGPTELADRVKKDHPGLKLRGQEVSTIKGKLKTRGLWPPTPEEKPAQNGAGPAKEVTLADKLRRLKEAADAVGGVEEAIELLQLLK